MVLLASMFGLGNTAQAQVAASLAPAVLVVPAVLTTAIDPVAPAAPQARLTLEQMAETMATSEVNDADQECLAVAIYFEARGEPVAGQLAVAQVVLNRARSGIYPPDVCSVVKQPAQFSFVRRGRFPAADRGSDAWRRAVAVSRIARDKLAAELNDNVLWYHAAYVAPSWGKRLRRETRIGLHIFYS